MASEPNFIVVFSRRYEGLQLSVVSPLYVVFIFRVVSPLRIYKCIGVPYTLCLSWQLNLPALNAFHRGVRLP